MNCSYGISCSMPCFLTVNTGKKSMVSLKTDHFLPQWLNVISLFKCCVIYLTVQVRATSPRPKRWHEQGKLLLSIMLQQHREFMTLKRWKFTVTEHLIVTSFEGKRARTRFLFAINKLRRFKYLSVWAGDQILLLLLSVWGSIAETELANSRISAAMLSHAQSKAHCTLTVTFPWTPTPSFGVLSAVQSQFQAWWPVSD